MAENVKRSADQVSHNIMQALGADERLREQGIRVHVYDGSWGFRVMFEGTVSSWADRTAAERYAWDIRGVSGVDNSLIASPQGESAMFPGDATLSSR